MHSVTSAGIGLCTFREIITHHPNVLVALFGRCQFAHEIHPHKLKWLSYLQRKEHVMEMCSSSGVGTHFSAVASIGM